MSDRLRLADPDPRVIEGEIRTNLETDKVGSGYIYHRDHSVPSSVTLEQ